MNIMSLDHFFFILAKILNHLHMRLFDIIAVILILLITFAGAYMPLFNQEKAKKTRSFPLGQAFSAGVFLALALTLMLPSAFHIFRNVLPCR